MSRAKFVTEQTTHKQKVLIITERNDIFTKKLKIHLTQHDLRVFISPHTPDDFKQFDLCFVIRGDNRLKIMEANCPIICIFFHTHKKIKLLKPPKNTKIIHLIGDSEYAVTQIQTIIWFAISTQNHSPILTLESTIYPSPLPAKRIFPRISFSFSPLFFKFIGSLVLVNYLFFFWIPLGISSIFTYQSAKHIQSGNLSQAVKLNEAKTPYLTSATTLYKWVRPLYLFFSLAQFPDDIFVINTTETKLTRTTELLFQESQNFSTLIFNTNRTPSLAHKTRHSFDSIQKLLNQSEEYILTLYRKIPASLISNTHKGEFQRGIGQLRKAKKVVALLPALLGEKEEQNLLLLFANNMELRPGGGFIGSFGVLKTHHFGLKELNIYDVYDADGQLTAHVVPPHAIRDYLNQPHWYLRDSAFFPDFYDTYQQATYFLQKEMGLSSWNGAALITTSAVKDIIGAYGELILPDYHERITKDNFYIKTQFEVENNFFPGSSQKKNFLSAIVKQILAQTELANPLLLSSSLVDGFDQKNMVLFMNDEKVQKNLDELFWSGRLAVPFCPKGSEQNCYADFQFPLDANLGVNKTNFFIDKLYDVKTTIDESGFITTRLTISYTNNSLSDVFPGGPYKNYFQIILPLDSVVTDVQIDGQQLTSYDSETGKQKMLGFLIEIPPQGKKSITLSYTSSLAFKPGKATYQLVLQKQIGALAHDVHFSLSLPANMNLLNTNFSPLVKNNLIIYNTDLSTDRVFFIELLKDHL